MHGGRGASLDRLTRKELLLDAHIVDLLRRLTLKQLLLQLLLHIIDVGVCCDAILRIFVSEVDLVTETLTELLTNLIRDVIIGHHRDGRILH